jgi:glycosyltransferase involved in cell wall biosynthesis
MTTKVTYVISNIDKALAFEWVIERLSTQKFELSFILLNPGKSVLEEVLIQKKILFTRITYQGKKDLLKAISGIRHFLKDNRTQVVHCHMFDANVAGLLAAKSLGIRKRIFTRHHATFHHEYFPRAVWYDRFINFLATDIVAISENVRSVLIEKEKVKPQKIKLIHHGFELSEFKNASADKLNLLRGRYLSRTSYPVIGVISRYFELKGIQYIIPAFKELLKEYPEAHLLLANATGNYKAEIQALLQSLPKKSYTEITFEPDLFSLYQLFDIFIHVPINPQIEAFGQTYVEALAAGVPSIFTLSGVATEFVEHGKNALVVPFEDSDAIYNSCMQILSDNHLKKTLVKEGEKCVQERFGIDIMIGNLENLYLCG